MKVLVTGASGMLGRATALALAARGDEVTVLQRRPSGLAPRDAAAAAAGAATGAGARPGADPVVGATDGPCAAPRTRPRAEEPAGAPVEAGDRATSPIREVLGDIADSEVVRRAVDGQDGIVHLAARVGVVGSEQRFESANVDGTLQLVSAARAAQVPRVVHVSTPSVAHAGQPLVGAAAGDADPVRTIGHYARTKARAEQIALGAADAIAVVAIRPHLVWGPGDSQLVGRIVARARAGRLALVDDGAALIDTTYVDNAVDALVAALDRAADGAVRGRAFVVSNGQPRTVAELLARICRAAGLPAPHRHVPLHLAYAGGAAAERMWARLQRTDDPPMTSFLAEQLATAHWFDQREVRTALHWQPHVGLEEGFERLAAWFATERTP